MSISIDWYSFLTYTVPVKQGSFGIRKDSPLDAFQLFYEELISSKPSNNRIRRIRPATTSKSACSQAFASPPSRYPMPRGFLFSTLLDNLSTRFFNSDMTICSHGLYTLWR
jgi:hypothetical protein